MDELTIKLLHERKNSNPHRKVNGASGRLFTFRWNADLKAYVYTTSNQAEADDIFNNQGRALGSYFAAVIPAAKKPAPIADHVAIALMKHAIELPKTLEPAEVAAALVAAFEAGKQEAAKEAAPTAVLTSGFVTSPNVSTTASIPAGEVVVHQPPEPVAKGKAPPKTPPVPAVKKPAA